MKGLLWKDFYMAMKYCRMNMLLIFIFAAGAVFSDNLFLLFYPIMMAGVVPISLISYDEKSKWNVYAGVFPYSKEELVSVKYIIALLFLAFGTLVIGIAMLVKMGLSGNYDWRSYGMLMIVMPSAGLVSPCILLPSVFRLGVEKGRVIYYAVLILVASLFGILGFMEENAGIAAAGNLSITDIGAVLVLLLFDAVILAGSWILAVRIYNRKEI